ncbi:hypothetical protein LTR78_010098 [Recurvomyces mirabilis]|uniref:Uncharacterized protein n=1 Tax=Recurvomyces mirabilis TaxID=574656 RepID=A0AAE0WGB5_9PEZI|nr:hypothetical protein LTR78_010098 [Recurvomyces mirabilis]KAK5150075.1 hypothetical protein LTS14_010440 [Recurvomyces mirabilis]
MAQMANATTSKPSASDIAAYDDKQLDRYLEENGRAKVQCSTHAIQSRAVDLDQVAARLNTVSNNPKRSVRRTSPSPTPPLPAQEEQDLEDLQEEIDAYPALIKAGGRPPYPIHLLKDIFDHPQRYLADPHYRDIMTFWRSHVICEEERTLLCSGLLSRWGAFRRVQRIIRECDVKSEWTLIHAADWDTWETFVEHFGPKEGEWGFPEYAKRMNKRLVKYGFTQPFQLNSDLLQQDTLTTWIEYLGYEYWFYDQHASYVKRFQRVHDKAWKKLVDSDALRPGETIEVVCNIDSVFDRAAENERAKEARKYTTAALSAAEAALDKFSASHSLRQANARRLLATQAARDTAEEDYQLLMRRRDAITDFCQQTKRYRKAYDDAEHHGHLLRWILQQVLSLERQSSFVGSDKASAGCEPTSHVLEVTIAENVEEPQCFDTPCPAVCGGSALPLEEPLARPSAFACGKRKHSDCEVISVQRKSKRLKLTDQRHLSTTLATVASDAVPVALTTPESVTESGSGGQELENTTASRSLCSQLHRPLRRSARIADQRALLPRSMLKKIVKGAPAKIGKRIGLVSGSERTTSRAARKSTKKADVHRPHMKRCLIPVE